MKLRIDAKILISSTLCFLVSNAVLAFQLETGEVVSDAVKKSGAIKPQRLLKAGVLNRVAWFNISADPKETPNDCKIDAMLIAKAAFAAEPNDFDTVRIRFGSADSPPRIIELSAKEISDFSSGKIDKTALLDFIQIRSGRTSLLEIGMRIRQYEKAGYNMKTYHDRLNQIRQMQESGASEKEKDESTQKLASELHMYNEPARQSTKPAAQNAQTNLPKAPIAVNPHAPKTTTSKSPLPKFPLRTQSSQEPTAKLPPPPESGQ